MNPYVFIVGSPRSGTTLLQRMVNAHPEIAITPETHWVPRLFEEGIGITENGAVTAELASRLLEDHRFTRLGIGRQELLGMIACQPTSYSSLVAAIFDSYGKTHVKALVGDKTPGYVRRMKTLHSLWPKARFVHLIRDGRDVCLSMASWPKTLQAGKPGSLATWKQDSVSTIAFWWELNVRCGRQFGASLGPGLYYEMQYESLVSHPREECESLSAFLDVAFDDAMLRFHEGRTRAAPGRDAKHAWLPITSGLRDWRAQMPPEDVERFEAAAGGLLNELGYARAFPSPRRESLEAAAMIRSLLDRDPVWVGLCAALRIEADAKATSVGRSDATWAGAETTL